MPWNSKKINLGFSDAKPWLPVNNAYAAKSAKQQQNDPDSMLNYTKELIKLRKKGFAA